MLRDYTKLETHTMYIVLFLTHRAEASTCTVGIFKEATTLLVRSIRSIQGIVTDDCIASNAQCAVLQHITMCVAPACSNFFATA